MKKLIVVLSLVLLLFLVACDVNANGDVYDNDVDENAEVYIPEPVYEYDEVEDVEEIYEYGEQEISELQYALAELAFLQ